MKRQGDTEGTRIETPEFDRVEFTRSCLASPTQLFRRSMVERTGGFDEQFRSGGDYEFQIRAALALPAARACWAALTTGPSIPSQCAFSLPGGQSSASSAKVSRGAKAAGSCSCARAANAFR